MTREHKPDHESQPHADHGGDDKDSKKENGLLAETSADAAKQITEFALHGKGKAKDMGRLMQLLTNSDKGEVALDFPALADRLTGTQFLECCAVFGYWLKFAIDLALKCKPPPSDAELRKFLLNRTESELFDLDNNEALITRLRVLMPGPLAMELPILGAFPWNMRDKPNLVRWYIDTMPVGVVAIKLASHGTPELANTLDTIDRWDWLDHLHTAPGFWDSMPQLAATTKNAKAKAKLDAMLVKVPKGDMPDLTAMKAEARDELDAAMKSGTAPTTPQLLDMTSRALDAENRPLDDMKKQMTGKSAAELLQFVSAAILPSLDKITMLLTAPDVGPEHILLIFDMVGWDDGLYALESDKLRPKIRKALGMKTPLLHLFPQPLVKAAVHERIANDEALVQWALEAKEPRDLLWIASGSLKGEKKGFRAVKEAKGTSWILDLPLDADREQLRRLVFVVTGKHKKHVERLLADKPIAYEEGDWETTAIDSTITGAGDAARFAIATRIDGHTEEEVMGRLSDLEPNERADVAKDPYALDKTLSRVTSDNISRTVFQLQPTIAQLLGTKLQYEPQLISYLRTRSAAEEVEAASSANLTKRAKEMFASDPFIIFPALLQPGSLAKALDKNSSLLAWIFADAEPNQALGALSKDPAKQIAIDRLDGDEDLLHKFPKYKYLLPNGKAGIDAITKDLTEDDAKEKATKYKDNKLKPEQEEVANDGKHLHKAAEQEHLWHAINALEKPDANTMLALVRQYPADHHQMLAGNHLAALEKLRNNVYLPPQIVFPDVTPMQLLAYPSSRTWLFEHELPFMVLALVGTDPGAQKQLGKLIDAPPEGVTSWIERMPRGAMLDASERATLDNVRNHVKTDTGLRALFRIRFGVEIEDTYGHGRAMDLWNALRRLPPAQVNQAVIASFQRKEIPNPGYWDDPDIVIATNDNQLDDNDDSYDNTPELTKVEIMRYYSLDEAAFIKATDKKSGWIEEVNGKFKVKAVNMRTFESTVLHEVGHSIDTLLGERTELVFGIAGWNNYGLDQVEEWANDMGALKGVSGSDKKQIIDAWRHALRAKVPLTNLVPEDHPAVRRDLEHVPLVKAAREESIFGYEEKRIVGDRVGLTGSNQSTLGTVPKETADVAPSEYSLSAPGEFFAECYVEYYRDFDGTASSAQKKGGRLPPAYRAWFDKNVDKVELNPHRYDKKDDPTATAPAPNKSK